MQETQPIYLSVTGPIELATATRRNVRLGQCDLKIRLLWKMQKNNLQNMEMCYINGLL